ncbi:MAG: hypothetical protein ACRDHY_03880 [Anaerolineales bacterium]
MQSDPEITGREWRWVAAISAAILILSSLPYLAGHAAATDDLVFSGAVYDRQDYAFHLSTMQQGARGSWQYQILVTADAHPAGLVRLLYLGLGHAARLSGLTLPAVFHAARLAFGAAALAAVYLFAARCLRPVALRRTALLFFGLGSGLGWLQLPLGWNLRPDLSPIDFWLIDAYGFFSLLAFPHFAAVIALLPLGFDRLAAYLEAGRRRDLLLAAAAGVGLQFLQPYAPWILDLTAVSLAVRPRYPNRRLLAALLALGLAQAPYFLYVVRLFSHDPVWASIQDQTLTLSPPPAAYLLGYGILTPLAVWGAAKLLRRGAGTARRLAVTWPLAAFALAYLPWNLQRRFTEGVMVPLAILAALGLGYGLLPAVRRWLGRQRRAGEWRRRRNLSLAFFAGAASISSLVLAVGGAALAASRPPEIYDPASIYTAAERLQATAGWQEPVVTAERTGSILAAHIGQRVVLGHVIETPFYPERSAQVRAFFSSGTADSARRGWLLDCGCRYVFFGPYERELGAWDPGQAPFLEPVITVEDVTVYGVRP